MSRSRLVRAGASAVGILLLLAAFTAIFIPAGELESALRRRLEQQGYTMRAAWCGKAFPFGLKARNLEISDSRGCLLRFDDCSARLHILPLLLGRFVVSFHGTIGGGTVSGSISSGANGALSCSIDKVPLEDIPLFRASADLHLSGLLDCRAALRRDSGTVHGEVLMSVTGAELGGVTVGSMPLPAASYETIRGLCLVRDGNWQVKSLALQGPGVFARLKGFILAAPRDDSSLLDLTLELMPKPEFLQANQHAFQLLARYRVSPGLYRLSIGGTLANPEIR